MQCNVKHTLLSFITCSNLLGCGIYTKMLTNNSCVDIFINVNFNQRCGQTYNTPTNLLVAGCAVPSSFKNGRLYPYQKSFLSGDTAIFQCNDGFETKHGQITCTDNGSWSIAPECLLSKVQTTLFC